MSTTKKALPIGVEFFRQFQANNFYYVDKTSFIAEFLNTRGVVNLFTRPRRFGKSLNMNMLKTFFEIGTDTSLFEGLNISRETELCEKHMGKYPVISLTLKDVEGDCFETAYDSLGFLISDEASYFDFLEKSDKISDVDKERFLQIRRGDFRENPALLYGSLNFLSRMLNQHYGRPCIILIDEYDVPLDKAYQYGYYEKMVGLIRSFLSQTLKTNSNMEFAVLTGCLRIVKESIFTGLNNFKVHSISDENGAEYFGFTDGEVKEMMRYYGVEERFPDMKEWYDGYHFGNVDVYCPWDVINQCDLLRTSKDASMRPHWENSSSNAIVMQILEDAAEITKAEIESLMSGEVIEKEIIPELTYTDLDNKDLTIRQTYLWSVLYATGYLTDAEKPNDRNHKLMIPNKEVHRIYEDKIRSWFHVKATSDTRRWEQFCAAVKNGDAENLQKILNEFLTESISFRDTAVRKDRKENFYHGILLGLLRAEGSWLVKSNAESGTGCADLLLIVPREKIGCVIEMKYAEKGAFDAACSDAMHQIDSCDYSSFLREEGMQTIHKYAVACYKKTCKVVHANLKS